MAPVLKTGEAFRVSVGSNPTPSATTTTESPLTCTDVDPAGILGRIPGLTRPQCGPLRLARRDHGATTNHEGRLACVLPVCAPDYAISQLGITDSPAIKALRNRPASR